jgi:hypothetical protein
MKERIQQAAFRIQPFLTADIVVPAVLCVTFLVTVISNLA